MNEPAPDISKQDRAAMLLDARKVLVAALDLILLSAPVLSLQIGVVQIAYDNTTNKLQMSGNLPVDVLLAVLGKAAAEAQRLAAAQPPKLVLPPGAIDPRRN